VLAYDGWPAVALLGPILLMGMAIAAFRLGLATRLMPFAGIAGVVIATVLTVWPEYQRLAPYLGNAPLFDVARAINLSAVQAVAVGLIATVAGVRLTLQQTLHGKTGPRLGGAAPTISAMPIGWPFATPAGCSRVRMTPMAASSSVRPTGSIRIASHAACSTRRTAAPGARVAPHRC
jgi:hypothetical protein